MNDDRPLEWPSERRAFERKCWKCGASTEGGDPTLGVCRKCLDAEKEALKRKKSPAAR